MRGPAKQVPVHRLEPMVVSGITPTRDLKLVHLSGLGLRRLGITRKELIEAETAEYASTRGWAAALHEQTECDGLVWVSRQNDDARALVLFGTRVAPTDLIVSAPPISLFYRPGLDRVYEAANRAGITVVI